MGLLQQSGITSLRQPTATSSGFLQSSGVTSLSQIKTTPTVKPVTTTSKSSQGFLSQATNVIKKIAEGIKFTFVEPNIVSPVPQSVLDQYPTTPQKPLLLKPDQKKLTHEQMSTIIGPKETFLKQAPKQTVWDKITSKISELFDSAESQKARAMNVMAIKSRPYGKELDTVKLSEKGGNLIKNTLMEDITKELGIRTTPTTKEFGETILSIAVGMGFITAPLQILRGLVSFATVNEIKSGVISAIKGKGFKLGANQTLSDLFENAPPDVKNVLDIIDFLATAKATHKLYEAEPKIFEKLTKDTLIKIKASTTINLTADEVRKINLGLGGKYESDLVKSLGLSGDEWNKAVREGLTIEIPTEKITRIVDKPYWKKIKSIIGAEPTNIEIKGTEGAKSKVGFAGYLTDGENTPQDIINAVMKSGMENTPEGKEALKTALEAERQGKNIVVEKAIEKPVETKPTETNIIGTGQPEVKPEIKPKTVSVPREQLPVGTSEEKVSKLEARVTKSLENINQETIDKLGLSTYKQMSKKENIAQASKYVLEKPEEALKVLSGEIEAPKGILRNSIYVAMQNLAIGDVNLARKLASLGSTRMGQEISILSEIDPNSPVKLMDEVIRIKEKAFNEKYKGRSVKDTVKKLTRDVKSKVKKIDKYDWNDFINSIDTC